MAIRKLPNGTIEADTASELIAYETQVKVRPRSNGSVSETDESSVDRFVRIFPTMWSDWGASVRSVFEDLLEAPNGKTDVELKALLNYTAPNNYQLAGTLQAFGKITIPHGYQYSDILIRTRLRRNADGGAKYHYELNAQATRAYQEMMSGGDA